MLLFLVALPAAAALVSVFLPDPARIRLLQLSALLHLGGVVSLWLRQPEELFGGFLGLDPPGLLTLTLISALYAGVAIYLDGYLRRAEQRTLKAFIAALLAFLSTVSLVCVSQHLGLFWVAIEAATLASAPLLYFHHSGRALEATWKYLIVSSVGIALALLGTIFLAVAATDSAGETTLWLRDIATGARSLSKPWLHAAFVFLLVGYGTKMGLAPMHAWKPDAYGESPPPIAALMAGALTSCGFLAVLRVMQICVRAGEGAFASSLLILLGLVSLVVAAVFIVGQTDHRRLLAYSSVYHMGILVFGLGYGLLGARGALLHVFNNALNKGILFLVAGNLLQTYGTSAIGSTRGALRRTPATGILLMVGLFAATGLPPFGLFVSEFTILRSALTSGAGWAAALYLGLLAIIFLGMAAAILPMAQGTSDKSEVIREPLSTTLPPMAFAAAALVLGVYIPAPFGAVVEAAARQVGG